MAPERVLKPQTRDPKTQTDQNTCACCGQPAADDAELCPACEEQLDLPPTEPIGMQEEVEQEQRKKLRTELVNLAELPNAFTMDNGFSYPDWELVREVINRKVTESERGRAWQDAVAQWLERLCSDLGGNYVVRESGRFVLLSCVSERLANLLFTFSEQTLDAIGEELGQAALMMGAGQYPIVVFSDEENYRRYLRHFHPRGHTEQLVADTEGICLDEGYIHIALQPRILQVSKRMLAHELTHATTAHLPIPAWLSEGLAIYIERTVVGDPSLTVGHELINDLRAFWTEKNIQTFWSGASFIVPGISNELSYKFAEILFRYLLKTGKDLIGFLKAADSEDGGQTAAINLLDIDLNDAVVEFLGPGEWRPNRAAIVEFRKTAGWHKGESSQPPECAA